jgi:hypothetical protein
MKVRKDKLLIDILYILIVAAITSIHNMLLKIMY